MSYAKVKNKINKMKEHIRLHFKKGFRNVKRKVLEQKQQLKKNKEDTKIEIQQVLKKYFFPRHAKVKRHHSQFR